MDRQMHTLGSLAFALSLLFSGAAIAHGGGGFHGGGFHGGGFHGGGFHGGGFHGHGYYGPGFRGGYYGAGWRGAYIGAPLVGYYGPYCNTVRVCNYNRCWLKQYCN